MAPPSNRRPGFSRRAQYSLFIAYVVAVAGALVGAVLIAVSTLDPPLFAAMRSGVSELTTPVSGGFAGVGRGIVSIPSAIGDYIAVHDQNTQLRRSLADERSLVMRARAIAYENLRLKHLLAVRERTGDVVVTARLVSSSGSSTRRYAVLNAGFRQGVHRGQPVRGPEGLIGQVIESGPDTARILLLTDPESVVPVRRTRDGLPALAAGRGDGLLDVKSVVSASAAFEPGDVFVTSGTGGIYAPNIPVARIVQRRTGDSAMARSFAQPDTLDFALVEQAFLPAALPSSGVTQ